MSPFNYVCANYRQASGEGKPVRLVVLVTLTESLAYPLIRVRDVWSPAMRNMPQGRRCCCQASPIFNMSEPEQTQDTTLLYCPSFHNHPSRLFCLYDCLIQGRNTEWWLITWMPELDLLSLNPCSAPHWICIGGKFIYIPLGELYTFSSTSVSMCVKWSHKRAYF